MNIVHEVVNGIPILKLSGRFDASGASDIEHFFRQGDTEPSPHFLVDLSSVSFLDSVGLAALLIGWKRCRQQQGELVLCGMPQAVHGTFELNLLDTIFPQFATQKQALAYLARQSSHAAFHQRPPVEPLAPGQGTWEQGNERIGGSQRVDASPVSQLPSDWQARYLLDEEIRGHERTDAPLLESVLDFNREKVNTFARVWLERGFRAFGIWGEDLIACWPGSIWEEMKMAQEADITLSAPIRVGEQIIGRDVLLGGTKNSFNQMLLENEVELISQVLTMKTHFERATQALVAQARVKTEIEVAARIQMQLLPQKCPQVEGLDIYAYSLPAGEVGGDCYDFVVPHPRSLFFLVADVSGKGVPAALLMAMTHQAFHIASHSHSLVDPQTILRRMNEILYDDLSEVGMFTTAFVGQYDANSQLLTYANAGHSPVVYCPYDSSAVLLEADAPVVGVLPENFCQNHMLPLRRNDVLVAGTDGLNESFDATGKMFGHTRLMATVKALSHLSAEQIGRELRKTISGFTRGYPRSDDQTSVILKAH